MSKTQFLVMRNHSQSKGDRDTPTRELHCNVISGKHGTQSKVEEQQALGTSGP